MIFDKKDKCSSCRARLPEDCRFCPSCGAPGPNVYRVCTKEGCDGIATPTDKVCHRCGMELPPIEREISFDFLWDPEAGAFFLTADDAEKLLVRSKEFYDGAIPSGNSMAVYNLLRLARLTGRADLEEKASTAARAFGRDVSTRPDGFTLFLSALDFAIGPSVEVVIAGTPGATDTDRMLEALKHVYVPNMVVILRSSESLEALQKVAPFVVDQPMLKGRATAYVCVNQSCSFPTSSPEEMVKLINKRTGTPDAG